MSEEFQFAVELIIASRNETGATMSDIQDDYYKAFGKSFRSMFGNCWTVYLRNLLENTIESVIEKQEPGGYALFFVRIAALQEKLLEVSKNKDMEEILDKLRIDPNNIKTHGASKELVQRSLNGTGQRSTSSLNPYFKTTPSIFAGFYNHTLIGDDFFLELCNIDLQMPKSKKNNVERIGLCISGQSIKSAYRTISYSPFKFETEYVILNIGTFDLLNGRSVEDTLAEIIRLLNAIKAKNLQPLLTTLAPLPSCESELDERRRSINKFIRENFDFIDIEKCFLSSQNRVLLDCYQGKPTAVGGSKHLITLWNRVGRQRVVQLMKREIPNLHPLF